MIYYTDIDTNIQLVILIAILVTFGLFVFLRVLLRYRYRRLWTEEYIVGEDEDLESISEKLGLPWKIMARVNKIKAPYSVESGQKIKVFPGHLAHPDSLVEPRITIIPAPLTHTQNSTKLIDQTQSNEISVTTISESSIESIALDLHLNLDNSTHIISKSEHIVSIGDTIDSIAKQFGLDWKTLAKVNNITAPYSLIEGQILHIPDQESTENDYIVQVGDTIETIAEFFDISWKELAKSNDIDAPYTLTIGQTLIKPKKSQTKSKTKTSKKAK
jgi:LysM repeat protein